MHSCTGAAQVSQRASQTHGGGRGGRGRGRGGSGGRDRGHTRDGARGRGRGARRSEGYRSEGYRNEGGPREARALPGEFSGRGRALHSRDGRGPRGYADEAAHWEEQWQRHGEVQEARGSLLGATCLYGVAPLLAALSASRRDIHTVFLQVRTHNPFSYAACVFGAAVTNIAGASSRRTGNSGLRQLCAYITPN